MGAARPLLLRRAAASFAVLLFFGAQGAGGLHLALVKHEICDHGQMVHGDHAEPGQHVQGANTEASSSLIAAHEDAHEHCSVPQAHSARELKITSATAVAMTSADLVEPSTPTFGVPFTADRYRFAPKQSPPA